MLGRSLVGEEEMFSTIMCCPVRILHELDLQMVKIRNQNDTRTLVLYTLAISREGLFIRFIIASANCEALRNL